MENLSSLAAAIADYLLFAGTVPAAGEETAYYAQVNRLGRSLMERLPSETFAAILLARKSLRQAYHLPEIKEA